MFNLSEFRTKATGFADLLGYAAMIERGLILNKDGSFTAAWAFRGDDLGSASTEELAALSSRVNSVFARLGSGWMIQVDAIREASTAYAAHGRFPDRTTRLIEDERRRHYSTSGTHFETRYVLSLTYLPPPVAEERIGGYLIGDNKGVDAKAGSRALATFKGALAQVEDGLSSSLRLERLNDRRPHDIAGGSADDELLTHINTCITGDSHAIARPTTPVYLDAILGSQDFYGDLYPRIGRKHIRPVSIVGYPQQSYPGMLDHLHQLPLNYRWSSRFIFIDPVIAEKHIESYEKKWFGRRKSLRSLMAEQAGGTPGPTNAHADAMASDAQSALAEAASGVVKFGYFTSVVIVMNEDPAVADSSARDVLKAVNNSGFNARLEDVNAVEAYLGSLPGNGIANVRRPLMHTLNVADLIPTTTIWSGPQYHPCPHYPPNSPPMAVVGTTGRTPFRLSLHVGDVGHTLVIGPTGSGKSTLLGFLMAQHFRYPGAQVFAFDKGHSAFILCTACGGDHYDIAGDQAELSFYPLANVHDLAERSWAAEWVETLLTLQGLEVQPRHRKALVKALDLLAQSDRRTLTDLVGTLQDVGLRDALAHYTLAGAMGSLLDADRDSLGHSDFQVFEIESLMSLGPKNVVPVLLYLFHRIERRLQGQPTLVVLDEAWLMLANALFEEKIRDWLKTLRKANSAVVFATHSPTDVLSSRIACAIVESCPTKIWLPNPDAASPALAPTYAALGLTPRQTVIIASAVPKRHYYYTSPQGRRLFDLDLDKIALSFVGAGSKEEIRMARSLREQYGDVWPAAWLHARGLTNAASAWMQYRDS